jgi:hypothetical protein
LLAESAVASDEASDALLSRARATSQTEVGAL